jgi:hypothetical protein
MRRPVHRDAITRSATIRLPLYIFCGHQLLAAKLRPSNIDASAATMKANQLRLWFAALAYVLIDALRRLGLRHTRFAKATAGTIRNRLLKTGALVTISVRRCLGRMARAYPYQGGFAPACLRLGHHAA